MLLVLKLIARALIPEVPESIRKKMAREKVELNRAKTQLINGALGIPPYNPHGAGAALEPEVFPQAPPMEDVALNIERR